MPYYLLIFQACLLSYVAVKKLEESTYVVSVYAWRMLQCVVHVCTIIIFTPHSVLHHITSCIIPCVLFSCQCRKSC